MTLSEVIPRDMIQVHRLAFLGHGLSETPGTVG